MALWLYIMRQIEMKMRRVSRNSFWQQHRAGCGGVGVLGGRVSVVVGVLRVTAAKIHVETLEIMCRFDTSVTQRSM